MSDTLSVSTLTRELSIVSGRNFCAIEIAVPWNHGDQALNFPLDWGRKVKKNLKNTGNHLIKYKQHYLLLNDFVQKLKFLKCILY